MHFPNDKLQSLGCGSGQVVPKCVSEFLIVPQRAFTPALEAVPNGRAVNHEIVQDGSSVVGLVCQASPEASRMAYEQGALNFAGRCPRMSLM